MGHALVDIGVSMGFALEASLAALRALAERHSKGDDTRISSSLHHNEFVDILLSGHIIPVSGTALRTALQVDSHPCLPAGSRSLG